MSNETTHDTHSTERLPLYHPGDVVRYMRVLGTVHEATILTEGVVVRDWLSPDPDAQTVLYQAYSPDHPLHSPSVSVSERSIEEVVRREK